MVLARFLAGRTGWSVPLPAPAPRAQAGVRPPHEEGPEGSTGADLNETGVR